jgi:tetratricopeptide (TPR) repeat protein
MALETYGRILMLQPTDADVQKHIETIASKTLELQTWADLYSRVLNENLVEDYQDKRIIMLSLARLFAERLDNHDKARELCRAMLAEEAEEMEAYDILEWSYAQKHDYSAMLTLWAEKSEIIQDQDEKLALMLRMATLQEEIANDDMAACKTYQAMLEIDQNTASACTALERLLRKTEQYKELADFYRTQSDYASDDKERVEYMHKLGVVLARELHDMEEATEVLENALSIQRDSSACKRAVESMLANLEATDENTAIRNRMATLLEPLYEDDEWNKLTRVLNVLIETSDDPTTKVALYMREAALYEAHDAQNGRAFETYAKAFVMTPGTAEAKDKLETLAQELNNYNTLAEVYEKAIQACEDDLEKVALYERVANIYSENLNDDAKAAECYEAVLSTDEFNLNAITALETIYAKAQNHDKHVAVLRKHAETVSNMLDQKDLYYRIAEIQESALNHLDDAIATYHAILELDTEDQISLDALERLYESNEKWAELIDIYKRKIDASSESSERIELAVKAAYTYKNRMNDVDSAIENYVQALSEDQNNLNILTSLEDLYTETKRYDDLLETLETKVNCDADNKHEHQLKMARILIENVNDNARAIEVLKSVLDEEPDTTAAIVALNGLLKNDDLVAEIADILMPIYKANDRDLDYVSLCERRIEVTSEDYEKRDIYMDAATVADEKLNDIEKAYSFITPALMANPTDDEIIAKAETMACKHEAYAMLTDLCEKVIADANDPDASIKLSVIAAKYYEENLNNIDKTIAQFERIYEIDALNENALENLHRLYKQTNHAKLAEILEHRIESGAQPINDIRFELVELKLDSEPEAALELLKSILWEDKAYDKAYDALEKLLAHKTLTLDIAEFLAPRYAETGENEKQASLLKARIDVTEDNMDAITLLKELAKLEQDVLNDEKAAFNTYVKALAKDPADTDVLNAIENIAENLQLWNELADTYPQAINACSDSSEKVSLYLKLAKVLSDKLQKHDDALAAVRSILDIDAENMDAIRFMENIYTLTDNNEELLNTKARLAELTFEMDEQKGILYQCADLALNTLGQVERGISFLEKIIEIDDTAIDAMNPLLTLYADAESHEKYVDLLNKKLLCVNDNDARYDIYVNIAETSANKLNDMVGAIEAYRNALDIKRSESIYKALENLYTKLEQYQDLDDLYMSMLDEANDAKAKAAIRIKRANIAEKQFNDDMQAIDLLKDALADDPASTDAFNALDAIYSKNGNFQDLYDLLTEQESAATSDDLKLTYSIRLAKTATHLGNAEAAIESLSKVLKIQPNNMEAIDSLVDIHEQQKSYDLALSILQRKLAVVDTNEQKSDIYCHVASIIRKANWDIEQVEKSYDAAIRLNPKNEKALGELMDIAKSSNNTKRQLELLNIKADNEDNIDVRNATFLEIADMAAAEYPKVSANALARVFETKSDDIELAEKLVNAYIKAGDVESAKPVLESIIENLTSSKQTKRLPPFHSLKGRMLKQAGDLAGARAAFEAANAIDKNNVPNNLELGIMLYEAEEYDAALKVMQSLLLQQMNVKDKDVKTNIFYYLGMLRVKTNDPKRAKDMFNRALGVDPNHAPTKEAMAAL